MTTDPDVKAQIEQALTPILWDQTGMTQQHFDDTMRAVQNAILPIVERERAKLREDAEQARVQLAGCLTAVEGATNNPAKQGDYGWSLAYQRTLELRQRVDATVAWLEQMKWHDGLRDLEGSGDERTGYVLIQSALCRLAPAAPAPTRRCSVAHAPTKEGGEK